MWEWIGIIWEWIGIMRQWIGIGIGVGLIFLFLRFTKVSEGTAKVVVRLGGFKKAVMAWKSYEFDKDWNVVAGKKRHFGGLRFVGIWPFDKVYKYPFRWRGIELVEGREEVKFHERTIDYIFLKPDVYWTEIKAAETGGPPEKPERIPLDLQFLVTMRVINPYKTLFRAPPNWLENVITRLNALFRDWVGTKTLDEILTIRKEPEKLWGEFKEEPLIKMFSDEWGVQIEANGIQIRDVAIAEPYRGAAARRRQLELEAEARKTRFEIEARARAAEVMGTVIESVATAEGKSSKEVEKEFQRNPETFYRTHKILIDNIMTKLSMEERAYLRIETPRATGALGDFLSLIAAWKRMPPGIPKEKERPKRKFPTKEEAEAALKKGIEETLG